MDLIFRARSFLLGFVASAVCLTCFGQTKQSAEKRPTPAPEMQSLERAFVGRWSTTYKFEPGGMSSDGGVGKGEEVWRTGPGGFTLMEEEHVQAPFGEIFLFALHWWDKSTNSLHGMLCNNSGATTCNVDSYYNSSLKWDGKQLVIDLRFPQGEKKMLWHEVWSRITDTSFTQTGDIREVGVPGKRVLTVQGTKVGDQ
ncbi:MAG TPA: hypothetical protein VHR84_10310 [Terriglobales bacterium]|jgi:hypothetical protein|nr:hypothetical protein [Terriglobales bacterium]